MSKSMKKKVCCRRQEVKEMTDTTKQDQWTRIIAEWETSGLLQKKFCVARGISLSLFCYWRARLRELQGEQKKEVACFEVANASYFDSAVTDIVFETDGIRMVVGGAASLTLSGRLILEELTRVLCEKKAGQRWMLVSCGALLSVLSVLLMCGGGLARY